MSTEVDVYIADLPADFRAAITTLRGQLRDLLPGHIECISYAMPGFREAIRGGKMVIGYAAFRHHLGLYPHSGNIIPHIDCTPFKTSKSGVLFTPRQPLPLELITKILRARQSELLPRPI